MKRADNNRALRGRLTFRANVRTTLSDQQPLNKCSAYWTRFSGATIDTEMVLELTTAVYPVNAGAVAVNAFL